MSVLAEEEEQGCRNYKECDAEGVEQRHTEIFFVMARAHISG